MLNYSESTKKTSAYAGTHGPGECSECDDPGTICCTHASYDDGSTDGATCTRCCTCRPGRHPLDRDRVYSAD